MRGDPVTTYIGICRCCREFTEVVHTRNYFGDPVSLCWDCLNNSHGKAGKRYYV